ncbi:unnamed protein product [Phytomonas sp. EM1]|nr:unnamed protein product [Phytomonas sp. EM1]|eukprot:CCW60098.1 unnamed protein product [Phytomonas sp. isolate EM1]
MILFSFICFVLWALWSLQRLVTYRVHDFTGKTVLITGACSELGARLCERLHAEGANLIAWDPSLPNLERLRKEVLSAGVNGTTGNREGDFESHAGGKGFPFFTITMVNFSSQANVLRAAQEVAGQVDIILHTAQVFPMQPFYKRAPDSIGSVLLSNSAALLLLAKTLCPSMLQRREGGHFVSFVTSPGVSMVEGENPDYAASQWATVGAHYSIRAWLGSGRRQQRGTGQVHTTLVNLPVWQEDITLVEKEAGFLAVPNFPLRSTAAASNEAVASSHYNNTLSADGVARARKTLNAEVDAALYAIARREEHYGGRRSWVMFLRAVALMVLPFPWQRSLEQIWSHIMGPGKLKNE